LYYKSVSLISINDFYFCKISSATASFDFNSMGSIFKYLSIKVTLFVGLPKPAPDLEGI
jgi:hypothetical protein